ncbi:MAG: DUF4127 family protein [Erysipelotrichaceae bacterium]|nr:DUF4127 family protein [Erysipelotrichaceae bacterium]
MLKIVHIPLDERPCNYDFPYLMFKGEEFDIVRVPTQYMGLKKKPGDVKKIQEFFENECKDAYAAIVSIDTLIYGGIVPSRLHYFTFDEVSKRLDVLLKVKEANPNIKIYAYSLVMRCPCYDDDDEEPFYYQQYGLKLHTKKAIEHKMKVNVATKEEINYYQNVKIPKEYEDDYSFRREINTAITCKVVELVRDNIISFLIVPQDDSAPYGYTALDQMKVRKVVDENHLQLKVLTYPGADEVSNTLFARMLNEYYHQKPLVYVMYPSDECKNVIPCAEDRPLDISVRSQIIASGCLMCDNIDDASLILAINAPTKNMISSQFRDDSDYFGYVVGRNLVEFVTRIEYLVKNEHRALTVCDIGYCNGSDPAFIKLLDQKKLYMDLAGYASWNIPCNSLGTALPMGIRYIYPHNKESFDDFLMHRYVEDIGYSCLARKILREKYCGTKANDYTIYDVHGQRDPYWLSLTNKVMKEALNDLCPNFPKYEILDMYFPWSRTYDIGLKVKYCKE